jgi:ABC-type transport system substrate-binding protein
VRDNRAIAEAWASGRLDAVLAPVPELRDAPDTLSELVPHLTTNFVAYCADRPPFTSALVRRAFSHAIDRERFVASLGGIAGAAVRGGAIPPAMPGHSHRVGPEYDPELSRRLLAEAGYPDGKGLPEVQLFVAKERLSSSGLESLVDQWAEIGARVRIRQAPPACLEHEVRALEGSQLYLSAWTADYPDPDGFFRGLLEIASPLYRDDELTDLLERARSLQDQSERMRMYHEIDRLWVREHAAILPLAYSRTLLLRRPWVEGLWANPLLRGHFDQVVVRREG